jgi:Flp pilus assembly protein TadG
MGLNHRDKRPRAIRRAARHLLHRFVGERRASVAIIFALTLIPILLLTGIAFDFTRAAQKQVLLNAAADAAAIAAVTPAMMAQSDANAILAAQNIFNAQASGIHGVTYSASNLSVVLSDQGLTRTATVTYTAASQNSFAGILKQATWPINGTSKATATVPPNIDFYLLLDNSPSMSIAATTAGINLMVANTPTQGGCAFACHESHPSGESPALGNPGGEDNYTLAKNLGVVTRIQNVATAAKQLTTVAAATEAASNAAYRMAVYTFNGTGTSTVQTLTSSMTTAGTAAGNIDVLQVRQSGYLTSGNLNHDADTNFETAMSNINGIMPTPGTGAAAGTPQEVLFIVSDGVDNEFPTFTCSQPLESGSHCQQPFDTTWCTTIKNRGIRIAVLYTVYLPLPTNWWYNLWIAPFSGQIATNMQSCASSGLYFSVTTDGDISAAIEKLFTQAVATARLTQ